MPRNIRYFDKMSTNICTHPSNLPPPVKFATSTLRINQSPHSSRACFPPPRPRLTHYAPAFHLHALRLTHYAPDFHLHAPASLITRPLSTSMPPPHSLRACFPPPRPRLTHYAPAFHLHAPASLITCPISTSTHSASLITCPISTSTPPPHSLRTRFPPPCAPDIYSTIKRQNFILKSENYIKTILLPNMAKPYLPRKGFHQLAHTIFPRLARHIKKKPQE